MSWYKKIILSQFDPVEGEPVTSNPFEENEFEIRQDLLPAVEAKMKPLIRRAEKLGLKPIEIIVSDPFPKEIPPDPRRPDAPAMFVDFVKVTIVGEPPVLSGWEFAATLEHVQDENRPGEYITQFYGVPGISIPEFYRGASPLNCDACPFKRYRKNTFVVRNTQTGEFKQVGSECIKKFLGYSPNLIRGYIQDLQALFEIAEQKSKERLPSGPIRGGGGQGFSVDTRDVVAAAAQMIAKDGFKPSAAGSGSTAEKLRQMFFYFGYGGYGTDRHEDDRWIKPNDADYQKADEAMKWIQDTVQMPGMGLGNTERDENTRRYFSNLATAVSIPTVGYRGIGLLASLIPAYERNTQAAKPKKDKLVSNFIGQQGQKVLFKATYQSTRDWEGDYGMVYYNSFIDAQGNKITWRTGKPSNMQQGEQYYIMGVIKQMKDDPRWGKQTVVTGKLVPEEKLGYYKKQFSKNDNALDLT
jgi:hypothetical protein